MAKVISVWRHLNVNKIGGGGVAASKLAAAS